MEERRNVRSLAWLALLAAWLSASAAALPTQLDRGRLAPGERGEAWLEDRWHDRFELAEIEVRLPAGDGTLAGWDHTLRVAVLTDDGEWSVVLEVAVAPESLPPPEASPLADDAEALAFLERVGVEREQFEFFLDSPMAATLPTIWQAQGIAREEIPDSILRLLEGEEDGAATRESEGAAVGGEWSRQPGSIVYGAALPESVLARGVRFSLVGDAPRGGAWRLIVRGVPIPDEVGFTRREWTYTHVW